MLNSKASLNDANAAHPKKLKIKNDDIYVPCGHEFDTGEMFTLPPNCNLIVVEPYGHGHNWDITKGEILEYQQLSTAIKDSHIFKNPVLHASKIIDVLGPVAIYESGEKAPELEYSFLLDWKDSGKYRDIRYSGLIPLSTFTSPQFTTTNIITKLVLEDEDDIEDTGIVESNINWVNDKEEIYKFSIFPLPDVFSRFRTNEGIIGILDEFEKKTSKYSFGSHFVKAIRAFNGTISAYGGDYGYICQSLENLMQLYPGTYIHIVCRTAQYDRNLHKKQFREMITHRVPYMSRKQLLDMSTARGLAQLSSANYGPNLIKTIRNQINVYTQKNAVIRELNNTRRNVRNLKKVRN